MGLKRFDPKWKDFPYHIIGVPKIGCGDPSMPPRPALRRGYAHYGETAIWKQIALKTG